MQRRRYFDSLHFKIASAVIATILITSTLYFVADYRSNQRELLAELEESAEHLAAITLQGFLELAMVGKHPELLQPAIERLGENSSVEHILLLDLEGRVHFSSDPSFLGRRYDLRDEGCRECHNAAASPADSSLFIDLDGRHTLRTVRLVPNRRECHACHGTTRAHNGMLVIDFPTEAISQRLRSNLYQGLYRAGTTVLLMLLVLGVLLNKLVILPLGKLRRATTGLAAGEPSAEAEALSGSGEIGQLAESFDRMAEQVRSSIGELQNQRAHLQNLMDSLPDGLLVVDRDLQVETANRGIERFWSQSEVRAILGQDTPFPEIRATVQKTLGTGTLDICEVKLPSPSSGGEPINLEIYCAPVQADPTGAEKAVLLIRDVTQRKQFEAQVSRADRLASVGRLAAGFAHEINNPMAAITTCVEGLGRHLASSSGIESDEKDEIGEYLSTVGEAAQRCKAITQRLLSASVERDAGVFQPLDLWELIQDSVKLLEHQARRQAVQLVPSRGKAGLIMGNPQRLSQLLLNLLLNGVEASAEGGTLEISLANRDGAVELRVTDTGCGISEENLERIFDPFFTTKTEGRGTGLGLFISQWIVRQHHGRMHVQSEPGQGTSFSIVFPRLEDPTP